MADTVTLGIVVAICSTVGPVLVALVQSRNRRKEKAQDYAREDAVAERAAVAARLLAVNTQKVVDSTQETHDKLDVIHVLVNSNMTAAMQAELDATVREAAMIQEVIDLKRNHGIEPTVEALATLESARKKISELRAELADRLRP
jgi:hypothetical protein